MKATTIKTTEFKQALNEAKKSSSKLYEQRKRVKELFFSTVLDDLEAFWIENKLTATIHYDGFISKTELTREDFCGYDSDSITIKIDSEFDFFYAKQDLVHDRRDIEIDYVRVGEYFTIEDIYPRHIPFVAEKLLAFINLYTKKADAEIKKLSEIKDF